MQDDVLLKSYVRDGSEAAFSEIITRHHSLVHGTCRRELGSVPLAEDAAQVVFLLLARKAKTLRAGPCLAGWLYQTAVFVAKDLSKQEARLQRREGAAMQETLRVQPELNPEWESIEPLLNSALSSLKAADREAVLLRFFEGHTLAETGTMLGLTEDGARMRVNRALEKMRRYFSAQGVTIPLAVIISRVGDNALHPNSDPDFMQSFRFPPLPESHLSQLTQGVLHTMFMKQMGSLAAVVVIGLAAFGAGAGIVRALTPKALRGPLFFTAPGQSQPLSPQAQAHDQATAAENRGDPAPITSVTQKFRLDEVRITGNRIVPAAAILAGFSLNAGDITDERRIQNHLTRVYNLAWFQQVGPYNLTAKSDGGYLLTLPVQENHNLVGKPEEFQEQAEIGSAYYAGEDALRAHNTDQFALMFTTNFREIDNHGKIQTLPQYVSEIDGPLGPDSLIGLGHYMTESHRVGNLVRVSSFITWGRWTLLPGSPDTGCEEWRQPVEDDWHQSSIGWVLETRKATGALSKKENTPDLIHYLKHRNVDYL